MATIIQRLAEVQDPRKSLKGSRFDFMIHFKDPSGKDDETDVEVDFYDLDGRDFRDEIVDFWNGFLKDNGWQADDVDVTAVWASLPEDLSEADAVTVLTKTGSFLDWLMDKTYEYMDKTEDRLSIDVRILDGESEANQEWEDYDQDWDIFCIDVDGKEYGPFTFQQAALMLESIYIGYRIGNQS